MIERFRYGDGYYPSRAPLAQVLATVTRDRTEDFLILQLEILDSVTGERQRSEHRLSMRHLVAGGYIDHVLRHMANAIKDSCTEPPYPAKEGERE